MFVFIVKVSESFLNDTSARTGISEKMDATTVKLISKLIHSFKFHCHLQFEIRQSFVRIFRCGKCCSWTGLCVSVAFLQCCSNHFCVACAVDLIFRFLQAF